MRRTQTRRPLICLLNTSAEKVFWTRGCQSWKNGGAALAVLDAQQARLLGQQTRNDRAISEARNKLSSVTESLNTARNALTRAEQQLTQQKNTPDSKTIVSPEKFGAFINKSFYCCER